MSREIKMNVEGTDEVEALKKDLYMYRELVVRFNNVLEWEQPFYPLYMIATISFIFFMTWYLSPPFVMMISVVGLAYFSFHLLAPRFLPMLLSKSEWDTHKEAKLTSICVRLLHAWKHFQSIKTSLSTMEKNSPKVYYPVMMMMCGLMMWVGLRVNAFLLMYFICIVACMVPGLRRHKLKEYIDNHGNQ